MDNLSINNQLVVEDKGPQEKIVVEEEWGIVYIYRYQVQSFSYTPGRPINGYSGQYVKALGDEPSAFFVYPKEEIQR